MNTLVIASFNPHKIAEYKAMLPSLPLEYRCLRDYPMAVSPAENGRTLQENAMIKAGYAAALTGRWAMGDDTGLEVAVLGGAPGIFSARYAGPECNAEDNNRLLLENLRHFTGDERKARFVCCIALVSPAGEKHCVSGVVEGRIAGKHSGIGGFGYDSLFIPDGFSCSYADMSAAEKNSISHRRRALNLAVPYLKQIAGL